MSRIFYTIDRVVLSEEGNSFSIVGEALEYDLPELFGMIFLSGVREFMDDHGVDRSFWIVDEVE